VLLNEQDFTALAASNQSTIIGKPTEYALAQNFPNPFNPSTTIRYEIPDDAAQVKIMIYNSVGELIKTLVDRNQSAGTYETVWDGTNDIGAKISSGVYYYRIIAVGEHEFSTMKKMLLVK
jgi:flagellar hook assembly protein FlgD